MTTFTDTFFGGCTATSAGLTVGGGLASDMAALKTCYEGYFFRNSLKTSAVVRLGLVGRRLRVPECARGPGADLTSLSAL